MEPFGKGRTHIERQRMQNRPVERLNARFRDKLLNREIFYSLKEAQIITEG